MKYEDMMILEGRVRHLDHPDTEGAVFINCTNKEVNKLNSMRLNQVKGENVVIEAVNTHMTIKDYKPLVNEKGTVKDTPFMQSLRLKVGARVQLTYNIDTLDGLSNGARGIVEHILKNSAGQVEKIMIRFDENYMGKKRRDSQAQLAALYPGCVFV